MSDESLEYLATRVAGHPRFLASVLAEYARSEGLDDDGLAAALGCTRAGLTLLRLCGLPRPDPQQFRADVEAIATRHGISTQTLAEVVRRGQSLARLRAATARPTDAGAVIAAREDKPEEPAS